MEVIRSGPAVAAETEFVTLYRARFADLAGQLYAFIGDASDANDLVQEAFVRAWQRWGTVGVYDDPAAWVRRVAWNLARNRHRRLALYRRWAWWLDRQPDPYPTGGSDNRVTLVAALRRLSPHLRQALVLHYLADLSIAEIADETGVALGTVKSWLHRGRTELANQLTEEQTDD